MIQLGKTSSHQFTPFKISQVEQILPFFECIDKSLLNFKDKRKTPSEIIYFFLRYLAGGGNLKGKAIDIDIVEFIDHMKGKKSNDKMVFAVAKQTQKMIKVKDQYSGQITPKQLEKVNKEVVKESRGKGYRNKVFWVGDIKIKRYAYKVCDESMIGNLLHDYLNFLNDDSIDLLNRLIVGTHQFYAIHPFKDGNGRTWRSLFWFLFSNKYDEVQTLFIIFYFKLIDYEGLYLAQNELRKGRIEPFVIYWKDCIEWSFKALTFYQSTYENNKYVDINQIYQLEYWLKNEKRNAK
ncbi:Fic family protein [Marinicella sp. S1101]|uniref:Fic family protein n=1 Tax=Marinicella marina TaxID=2996016 RepID=UPI002260D85E|nr:Fic family protein [Marinicella marina]MCX7555206.1 Fic family protein [Marinicella marina]MDJ1141612.1 Fic family protein [Marinicella marina]